jgi:hypothetical protein
MKESDQNNDNIIDTSQKQNIIEQQPKNDISEQQQPEDEGIQNGGKRMTSFEIELLKAVKKEEEERQKKMELDKLEKIQKKLTTYHTKDYLFFFTLLMSSPFNFSYLNLVNMAIALIYFFFIESLSVKAIKTKYLCEVFSVGYSSYSLIFKLMSLVLIEKENDAIIKDYPDIFLNLGICYLKDKDSRFYFLMTFIPEIFVIIVSGYSVLISFYARTCDEKYSKYKELKMLTLRRLILLAYTFIVLYSLFNISFLSLIYIILIQFVLLLNSIRITEKEIKAFFHFIVYLSMISLFIAIILTNLLNIPTLQESILGQNHVTDNDENVTRYFSIFTQFGIKYAYYDSNTNIFITFLSYLFSVLLLMTLYFIHIELKSGRNIKSEEEYEKLKKMQEMSIIESKENKDPKNKIDFKKNGNYIVPNAPANKNKSILNKNKNETIKKKHKLSAFLKINIVYRVLNFLMTHPNFNYEIERIISILWTYYYRSYYSLGMYLVLFCSFFF